MAVSSTRQELLPSLCIVEHQQLQALHKQFCQQLREGELDQQATPSSFNMLAELEAFGTRGTKQHSKMKPQSLDLLKANQYL
eukprot:Em0020g612a